MSEKFEETKGILLEFISNNPKELQAINLYLECLWSLKNSKKLMNLSVR